MATIRIAEFDTWRPGYGGDSVRILKAGTEELAPVFLDEAGTIPAPNPQTLLTRVDGSVSYGKFGAPIYAGQAFSLRIGSIDATGTVRPSLTTLGGEDASAALVTVEGGSRPSTLAKLLGRAVDVRDYGEFLPAGSSNLSAATNTATLTAAIGAVAASGGGFVMTPGGVFPILNVSVPAGVTVRGRDREGTALQSTLAGRVATIAGDSAGFSRITLDGLSQVAKSVGVYAIGIKNPIMDDVRVRRFEQGYLSKGSQIPEFTDVVFSDNVRGCDILGDMDASDTKRGAATRGASLGRARFELNAQIGLNVEFVDAAAQFLDAESCVFDTNTGVALRLRGARFVDFNSCLFFGNTRNLDVDDVTPANPDGTIASLRFKNTLFDTGEITLKGTLEDVVFERCQLNGNRVEIITPKNPVLALDCREDFAFNLAGTPTAWQRRYSTESGSTSGLTTGDAPTKTWAITLDPGQRVFLVAKVIGRGRNNNATAFYYMAVSAERPPASLAYDSQTGNFTPGNIVRGATSGAAGRIVVDTDAGTTGTLRLIDLVGTFLDDEIITDGATGSATANGTAVLSDAVLVGGVTDLRAVQETVAAWAATFSPNGPQIELRVTGAAGSTVEWTTNVEVVST